MRTVVGVGPEPERERPAGAPLLPGNDAAALGRAAPGGPAAGDDQQGELHEELEDVLRAVRAEHRPLRTWRGAKQEKKGQALKQR